MDACQFKMFYYVAESFDDVWATSKEYVQDDEKRFPPFRYNRVFDDSIIYQRFLLVGAVCKARLYLKTRIKYVRDLRKLLDSHEKITITRLSKKAFYDKLRMPVPDAALDVKFNLSGLEGQIALMKAHIPAVIARSDIGKVLSQCTGPSKTHVMATGQPNLYGLPPVSQEN